MQIIPSTYGLMAEFDNEHDLVAAAQRARAEGYSKMDAYTPYPVEGVIEVLDFKGTAVALITLVAALVGLATGYLLPFYLEAINYPINVGGRPLNSWPMWVPIMFELTVLFGGLACAISMLLLNRLPEPYHPVFNVPRFGRASQDGFFLLIESADPKFDREATRRFLADLNPREVSDVRL